MEPMQLDMWDLLGEEIPGNDFYESLRRGSGYEDGRLRIYAAINRTTDNRDLAEFIRKEYGTGGCSYTWQDGNRGFIDYDAKGYKMRRWGTDEKEKKYSWMQVAEAILDIARKNQYLTPEEHRRFAKIITSYAPYGKPIPMPKPRMKYAG